MDLQHNNELQGHRDGIWRQTAKNSKRKFREKREWDENK